MYVVVAMITVIALPFLALGIALVALRAWNYVSRQRYIGFFHPYAASGGGGERVLFCALQALPASANVVIYIGDAITVETLLKDAQNRFNFKAQDIKCKVNVFHLKYRYLLEAKYYPRFTLLGQSLGSMILGLEAFLRCPVTVWIDTTGCAFTYPCAWLGGATVVTYTHYPTISMDMLQVVARRDVTYNNSADVAGSRTKSQAKLWYYQFFAYLYGFVGAFASIVMVNSGWTYNHIRELWKRNKPLVVYPPCGSSSFEVFPLSGRSRIALSVGQFRPEKDHSLQLAALKVLIQKHPEESKDFKLVLLGSCRGQEDEARVQALRNECDELGISDQVEFVVNASYGTLKEYLAKALIGLHTMRNEHFGIGIVEMMAAGMVVIAHNSGGPAVDIVKPGTGYLASAADEYASAMYQILTNRSNEDIQRNGRASSHRFSDEVFQEAFCAALSPIFNQ
ncbi:GDP-Man:Man(3)GlcNAc(2)-PP-Dol alpha-1,2-mannosyltransferase isoform X2 [Thraustotheca clavata]|uniref:GDP-Man:Man(3)GlcNAc(2)-PP-Dol alpha-1,2-mannosyltransferase n=1 Tax=Thraustotheca clavata TaxID=74557 RepID=A0A1W0A424_9STRA|nr:GDP-Man:Man(3)GlcNAc(2)-PP-Dol alpha-1,2-mannosyltransferase isoform X2 [Thraustotheca clavata]